MTLVTLEVSTPGVDTVKESETSRQLTEDAITKLDSDTNHTIGDEQHRLSNTQHNSRLTFHLPQHVDHSLVLNNCPSTQGQRLSDPIPFQLLYVLYNFFLNHFHGRVNCLHCMIVIFKKTLEEIARKSKNSRVKYCYYTSLAH